MGVRILVTGGTFDKEYNELDGTLAFKDTHVAELLQLGRCKVAVKVRTLMLVDSLDMTEADRLLILDNCRSSPETRLVITHGTDTMVETAKLLGARLADGTPGGAGKTVVLTGAMIPFKFGSSDGLFNMGSALAFAQALPPGVYVAMNGRVFPWSDVRKNRDRGEFEEASKP